MSGVGDTERKHAQRRSNGGERVIETTDEDGSEGESPKKPAKNMVGETVVIKGKQTGFPKDLDNQIELGRRSSRINGRLWCEGKNGKPETKIPPGYRMGRSTPQAIKG